MKTLLLSVAFGTGFLFSAGAFADAPAGAIAQCKDGTYFTGTTHKGACKGHQGVQEWLDKNQTAAAHAAATDTTSKKSKSKKSADSAAPATAPAAAAPATAPAPAAKTAPATDAKHTAPTPASEITQKVGGGPGLVWVNSKSKAYHCQGDEWYGKTKEGSYMSEAAAKTGGNHAAGGKECGTK